MNREEQFERRLQREPLREIPSGWREEILSAARAVAVAHHSAPNTRLTSWWRELFWPHPIAWGALASVWLLILGINFAMREPHRDEFANRSIPPSPQMRELLYQQERLFAELVGLPERTDADRPKTSGPRSQRHQAFFNA